LACFKACPVRQYTGEVVCRRNREGHERRIPRRRAPRPWMDTVGACDSCKKTSKVNGARGIDHMAVYAGADALFHQSLTSKIGHRIYNFGAGWMVAENGCRTAGWPACRRRCKTNGRQTPWAKKSHRAVIARFSWTWNLPEGQLYSLYSSANLSHHQSPGRAVAA